ncbi:MAG: iron chelate uptake ABC transporter family permease subunit [Armatimonadota bacterium]|nr:iron chelate uptake ABC transporter family permease subunit [Armatimonadota bacterium]MDR7466561.1 iron chelate uptake ABC transporter family permease subunit [Armatimonadota bacterium]MDR7493283.1 iron chelate uptake ABC transporter family permease subunit [Armatimonadota bacterium]MDR7499824.1 iron chelate uptake ABC transporter family permease subunit [Armatimonadota bacterium]MDR7504757.1 iron chelate uptake ABC transporter family permease subunit [Armatimonadota bacterium]
MARVEGARRIQAAGERPGATWPVLAVLGTALVLFAVGSAAVGSVRLPPAAVLGALGVGPAADEVTRTIVLQVRLPRIALAAVVGVALAASGTVLQGVFRNPMADPYIIGVSAGAALGATAAIVFGFTIPLLGVGGVSLAAFAGAVLVTLLVYRLAWFRGEVVVEHLLLAGVAVGAFLAAVISAMQLLGGESLQQVIFWLMGGFGGRSWPHVLLTAPYVAAGYLIAWTRARDLNLLVLGDETARSLGAQPGQARAALIAAASLMAAAAVAASGLIGFVGLVVPHLLRLVVGPDHRRLLPAAALAGGCTMLVADAVARAAAAPGEIPVGIVTAALGAPFFLYLLRTQRRRTFWS